MNPIRAFFLKQRLKQHRKWFKKFNEDHPVPDLQTLHDELTNPCLGIPAGKLLTLPVKKETRYTHEVKVYYGPGEDDWVGIDNNRDPVTVKCAIKFFYGFYHWFYYRQTPYYTLLHCKGAIVVVRSEIKRIEFITKEVEVDGK